MFKSFDRSARFAKFLENLSSTLARQRGLPVVIGVGLIIISFIVHLMTFVSDAPLLDFVWTVTHHLGLIIALIGILLVEPLGQ